MKKGVVHIFLLIVIVLIGIAGIGYFAYKNGQIKVPRQSTDSSSPVPVTTETDADMSNWKTYINEMYNFTFDYPNNWKILDGQVYSTLPRLVTFETKTPTNIELEMPFVTFFVAYHDNVQNIDKWLSENFMGATVGSKKVVGDYEYLVVNGGTQFQSREYILNIGQLKYLRFVFEPTNGSSTDEVDIDFNQILSTFKFYEKTYPDWNLYVNNKLGFYFEYPNDWEVVEKYYVQRGLSNKSDYLFLGLRPTEHREDFRGWIRLVEDLSVNQLVEEYINSYSSGTTELLKKQDVEFHGLSATEITAQNTLNKDPFSVIIFNRGNYNYVIPGEDSAEDNKTINTIMSTFRFEKKE